MTASARLLVTGGRAYANREVVSGVLGFMRDCAKAIDLTLVVVHGAAPGLDTLAAEWARAHGVADEPWPAKWSEEGAAAGPLRNARMIATRPRWVISFPGGRGTADCTERAVLAGLTVGAVSRTGELRWWDPVPEPRRSGL